MYSLRAAVCPDVDAPQDLSASNIQTETGLLTWRPPRADITGYILSFESADGVIRVSRGQRLEPTQGGRFVFGLKVEKVKDTKLQLSLLLQNGKS